MTRTWKRMVSLLLLAAAPAMAEITRDELKQALEQHPDVLIEFLRDNRADLLEIVSQAAAEARATEADRRAEAERRQMDEAFKNPLVPQIDDNTRVRGNRNAPLTLVEYSDFQCPYCTRGYETVQALRKKYGEQLRFVYKHLPLDFHPEAMPAAKFMEAISLQSQEKAWQFHDTIFENQKKIGHDFYLETARKLGVDVDQMIEDAEGEQVRQRIQADMAEAGKFEFGGTPGFLINGVPLRGAYPVDSFDDIITKLKGQE